MPKVDPIQTMFRFQNTLFCFRNGNGTIQKTSFLSSFETAGHLEQLQKQGKNDEALPLAQKALHFVEATCGPEHPNTAPALDRLGETDIALRSYSEAESLVNRALPFAKGPSPLKLHPSRRR